VSLYYIFFCRSFQSSVVAYRASKDPMLGSQFFATESVSKNLIKVQSFFHSAPQAVLQMILLIENDASSPAKGTNVDMRKQ